MLLPRLYRLMVGRFSYKEVMGVRFPLQALGYWCSGSARLPVKEKVSARNRYSPPFRFTLGPSGVGLPFIREVNAEFNSPLNDHADGRSVYLSGPHKPA